MNLFDHLKNLFTKNKSWGDFSEADKKEFSTFMINKYLSMDMNLTCVVNMIQEYSYGLHPEYIHGIYMDLLPKRSGFFVKYIKGKKDSKYNSKLINLLSEYYEVSKSEILDMLDIPNINIEGIIEKYGLSDKEIKSLMKSNKGEE